MGSRDLTPEREARDTRLRAICGGEYILVTLDRADILGVLADLEAAEAALASFRLWSSKAVEFIAAVGQDEQSEYEADELVVMHMQVWNAARFPAAAPGSPEETARHEN